MYFLPWTTARGDFQKCPFLAVFRFFQSTGKLYAVNSNLSVSAKTNPDSIMVSGFFSFLVYDFLYDFVIIELLSYIRSIQAPRKYATPSSGKGGVFFIPQISTVRTSG